MPLITKMETNNKSMYTNNIKSTYKKDSTNSSTKNNNNKNKNNKCSSSYEYDYNNTLSYIKNITS